MAALYAWALVREFRWSLIVLAAAVAFLAAVYLLTPAEAFGPQGPPSPLLALYGAWMALLAQPLLNPPTTWYLQLLSGLYPLLGAVLIGEGVVRLAILMVSRQQGERAWMKVVASTYRDHVVLCGLGHLGLRVLEQLRAVGTPVVVLEKHKANRLLVYAREKEVPVLIRDMKEDQALIDAGIPHARCVICCTNDYMANLEVALDSRRMNPAIRVLLRLYDQQVAQKIADAMDIDVAFSSSHLAAPIVAAMSFRSKVLGTYVIGGVAHVTAEVTVEAGSALAGLPLPRAEREYGVRVLARDGRPPEAGPAEGAPGAGAPADAAAGGIPALRAGDALVIHAATANLAAFAAAAQRRA